MAGQKQGLSPEQAVDATRRASPMGICIPDNVTNGQLGDVLLKHLRSNPETRHEAIYFITPEAFQEAFPCR